MIELHYAIPLPCPSNQLYRAFMGPGMKHPRTIMSARGRTLKASVIGSLLEQIKGHRPLITVPCCLDYLVTFPDKRPRDLDCYEKSLLDCLQAAGVVSNDRLFVQITKQSHPVPSRPGGITMTLRELPL